MNLIRIIRGLALISLILSVVLINQISVKRDYDSVWKEYQEWIESEAARVRNMSPTWIGMALEQSLGRKMDCPEFRVFIHSVVNYLVLHFSEGLFPWYRGGTTFQWYDLYILADSVFGDFFGPGAALIINSVLSILESFVLFLTALIMRGFLHILLPRGLPNLMQNWRGWRKVAKFFLVVTVFSLAYAESWNLNWLVVCIAPFIGVSLLEFLPATVIAIFQLNVLRRAQLQIIDQVGYAAFRQMCDWIRLRFEYWFVIPFGILCLISPWAWFH